MTCKVLRHQDNWGTPQAKYEPTPHKYQPTPHKYEPSPTKYEPSPTKYEPTPHRADLRRLRDNSTRAGGALRGGPAKKKPAKRVGGTYDVYVIPNLDPTMGEREVRDDDIDFRSSPIGWHDTGEIIGDFTTTKGNNVCAQNNPNGGSERSCDLEAIGGVRPDGGDDLNFVFEFDQSADPTTEPTLSAAITNLFYWHNIVHDIFYLNGFDEVAGNFQVSSTACKRLVSLPAVSHRAPLCLQENNFELGGLGDDGVQANAQDGAGFNNANFATPIDGQRPRCRMYLWNNHEPFLDGDFDSGIIIHEIGHGVSNRLTGGPNIVGCLPGGQSGGMGEGWSDWWAIALQQQESFPPNMAFPMGDYVVAGGIRICTCSLFPVAPPLPACRPSVCLRCLLHKCLRQTLTATTWRLTPRRTASSPAPPTLACTPWAPSGAACSTISSSS